MDTLIIQSYCTGRVMETSGDIALQFKDEGKDVGYFFIDVEDPFAPMPFGVWPFHAKKSRKVFPFKQILDDANIHFIEDVQQKTPRNKILNIIESSNFKSFEDIEHYTYDSMPLGLGVLSNFSSTLGEAYPNIL